MNTRVYNIKTIDQAKWNKIAIEKNNVCQTYEWALANRSIFNEPLFIVVGDNNNWVGGWMFFYKRIRILPSFFTRTIDIPSEPLIIDETNGETIVDMLWQEVGRRKPIYITWLNYANSRWKDKQFLEGKGFNEIIKYGSHILDLSRSEEELWGGMHSKHRNVIRKAEKEGIIVEESSNTKNYYYLSEETYKRSRGKGPEYQTLKRVYDYLNPIGMCKVFFAKQGDKLISGAFMLICGKKVTYWHGATCDDPPTGASNLLHWEMLKRFKNENYRWYDFGGAYLGREEGKGKNISRFKERFGGNLEVFYGGYKIYSPLRKELLDKIVRQLLTVPKYFQKLFKR